jgi:O-antigen/teichoic acid export membrane protein
VSKFLDKTKDLLGAAAGNGNKKTNFLTGALILALAGIICRVLGVILRIPLTNIVGNFGMGLYQMVFPLYALLLIISSAGVPVAISKMIAREKVDGNMKQAKRVLLNALILLGAIGAIFSALFIVFSTPIAALQGNRDVGIIYIAIAPSVFLVCIISALRGYFQGLQNMVPTAVSQIIEQLIKMTVGITLAAILIQSSVVMAVFGAIIAVTASEAVALTYLVIIFFVSRKKQTEDNQPLDKKSETQDKSEIDTAENKEATVLLEWHGAFNNRKTINGGHKKSLEEALSDPQLVQLMEQDQSGGKAGPVSTKIGIDFKLMWQILKQSLPITLMASVFPLILVFDSLVIINLLKGAGASGQIATQLYGIQSGAVHTLINWPAVIGVALATAVVPTVTSLLKQQKADELRTKCALAIKLSIIIAVFFVAFYLFFADKIIDLLYHNAFKDNAEHFRIAVNLLKIESAMIVLMGVSQVFTAMMQASDKAYLPLIALIVGGVAKIAFELFFVPAPMGIYAVSISNVICFGLAAVLNTVFALRIVKIRSHLGGVVLKLVLHIVAYLGFLFALTLIIPDGRWWLILIGVLAFVFYTILVLCLKLFDKSEKKVFNQLGK